MSTDAATENWQPYGSVAIASGNLLLADPAYVADLMPQLESGDLREIAQIIPAACPDGTYPTSVLRQGDVITAVRVNFCSE